MLKKLRWIIVIPGILMSVNTTLASVTALTTENYVEQDIFELHIPPQDLAQKDFQSADYKVDHLSDLKAEDKASLMESGKILYDRDWFLRRMEKTPPEDPAKTWLQNKWLKEHGFKEPFSKDTLVKYKPDASFFAKEVADQKARIKRAVKDYNKLVATIEEKRKIPDPNSVSAEETTDTCGKKKFEFSTPTTVIPTSNIPTTIAPETIAKLSKDIFGMAIKQNDDDTKAEIQKQVAAAKNDPSYVTSSAPTSTSAVNTGSTKTPLTLKFSTSSADSAVGNGDAAGSQPIQTKKDIARVPATADEQSADIHSPSSAMPSNPVRVVLPADSAVGAQAFTSVINVPHSSKLYGVSQTDSTINLYNSVDDGNSWQLVNRFINMAKNPSRTLRMTVSEGAQDIIIGTDRGAFVSSDQGASFSQIGKSGTQAVDVKLSEKGDRLIVGYRLTQGSDVEIFEKKNGVWSPSAQQPTGLDEYSAKGAQAEKDSGHHARFYANGVNLYSVQFDPNHPDVIYAGAGNQLYRWDSAGGWALLGKNVHDDSTVYNIDIDKTTGRLLMSTCNGVYQADSNQSDPTFTRIGNGTFLWRQGKGGDGGRAGYDPTAGVDHASPKNALRALDVSVDPFDPTKIAATADTGIYTSNDSGKTWKRLEGGDWSEVPDHAATDDIRTAAWTQDGSVVFSSNDTTYRATP
jgi:hypothetical protein